MAGERCRGQAPGLTAGLALQWRALSGADLDAVMAVEVGAYSHPWSRGNFDDSLRAGYLAEAAWNDEGEHDECHLLNLTVAPPWQRRGLARLALARLHDHARRLSLMSLWLEVRESNARAREVYRAGGWAEVGRRRGYYPGATRREDAVLMRIELPQGAWSGIREPESRGKDGHAVV
jgi:ribosomal-protein-alanine N-acetyltransferase